MLKKKKCLSNSGMAVMEMIPILIIIALLLNFSIGFFGVIHTGILNSIAARNYTFETFRHQANLEYFWREDFNDGNLSNYVKYGFRFHGIASENRTGDRWVATSRSIAFIEPFGGVDKDGKVLARQQNMQNTELDLHNTRVFTIRDDGNKTLIGAAPIWVRPIYGICLKAACSQP